MPLVRGEKVAKWRTDFFCEHLLDHPKIPKLEGVRRQRYVYARYFEFPDDSEFLYDLKTDPKQLTNLAKNPNYRRVLQQNRERYDELRDKLGGKYRKHSIAK